MAWTKVREKVAALVAVILVILVGAAGSAMFGWNIPVLSQIGRAMGLGQ